MSGINGIIGREIPYYSMIKKAMPKQQGVKKKMKSYRLTEIDPKTKEPRLKKGVKMERAIEVLYMFENTGVLPKEIEEMQETIDNLRKRVLKLEDWQK